MGKLSDRYHIFSCYVSYQIPHTYQNLYLVEAFLQQVPLDMESDWDSHQVELLVVQPEGVVHSVVEGEVTTINISTCTQEEIFGFL